MKTIHMLKETWERWDAALRSGKYRQGIGRLQTNDGEFCCLGVLQMCLDGHVEQDEVGDPKGLPSLEWLEEHEITFLNFDGVSRASPYLPKLKATADDANDRRGKNFIEIANAIADCVEFV
jgi:hypothetical protein